jgi:flavodoxin
MKSLVVYDSRYGCTEAIAHAIGEALPDQAEVMHVAKASALGLDGYDLLVVGAPTHAAKPSEEAQAFLDKIPAAALSGVDVAGFDTRMTNKLITLFGTAAPKIAKTLKQKGGNLVGPPGGFYVSGGEGPLKEGELERARRWAQGLVADGA